MDWHMDICSPVDGFHKVDAPLVVTSLYIFIIHFSDRAEEIMLSISERKFE